MGTGGHNASKEVCVVTVFSSLFKGEKNLFALLMEVCLELKRCSFLINSFSWSEIFANWFLCHIFVGVLLVDINNSL